MTLKWPIDRGTVAFSRAGLHTRSSIVFQPFLHHSLVLLFQLFLSQNDTSRYDMIAPPFPIIEANRLPRQQRQKITPALFFYSHISGASSKSLHFQLPGVFTHFVFKASGTSTLRIFTFQVFTFQAFLLPISGLSSMCFVPTCCPAQPLKLLQSLLLLSPTPSTRPCSAYAVSAAR